MYIGAVSSITSVLHSVPQGSVLRQVFLLTSPGCLRGVAIFRIRLRWWSWNLQTCCSSRPWDLVNHVSACIVSKWRAKWLSTTPSICIKWRQNSSGLGHLDVDICSQLTPSISIQLSAIWTKGAVIDSSLSLISSVCGCASPSSCPTISHHGYNAHPVIRALIQSHLRILLQWVSAPAVSSEWGCSTSWSCWNICV